MKECEQVQVSVESGPDAMAVIRDRRAEGTLTLFLTNDRKLLLADF
jgi:hypothetical protein